MLEISDDDPKLLRAKEILSYCRVTGEQLEAKLEVCKTEISKLHFRGSGSTRLINDAIHGPVELPPLMYKIINTPEFHRLKDIKQLGGAHYVYPGANHTRFDHSIGVYYLAGEFARHLQRQLKSDFPESQSETPSLFTDGEVVCAQIAGLCHDLGHGPLSHLFERYIMKMKHEDISVSIFKKLVVDNPNVLAEFVSLKENLGVEEFKLIELMIQPPEKGKKVPDQWKKREFLCEIVANKSTGVDVDKWDYYARDGQNLGLTTDFQERRCMFLGRIVKVVDSGEFHIAFRDKELDNIYGMFRTRGILHQKAYQHKTIKAVERMIADAILDVQGLPIIQVLGSKEPVSINKILEDAGKEKVQTYLALTDVIIGIIKCCPTHIARTTDEKKALERAKECLRRIETRDLYHCSWKIRIPKKENEDRLWRALEAMSIQPEGESISKFLPPDKKGITESDFWVPIEKIKFTSEEKDNPVNDILFYKKPKGSGNPIEILSQQEVEEMTSLLVVPQAFVECEVRVYDKRKAEDRASDDQEALKKALNEWKKDAEVQHNGAS